MKLKVNNKTHGKLKSRDTTFGEHFITFEISFSDILKSSVI